MRECGARSSFGQRPASLGMTMPPKNPSQRGILQKCRVETTQQKSNPQTLHLSLSCSIFHQKDWLLSIDLFKIIPSPFLFSHKRFIPHKPSPRFILFVNSSIQHHELHFSPDPEMKWLCCKQENKISSHGQKFKKPLTTGTR